MVVAADEIVGQGLSRVLRRAGFRAMAAKDGTDALERASGRKAPDLLVADLVMPKMGGLTLAERARELNPALRVLLMSSYQEQSLLGVLPRQGMAFIQKPLTPEALLDAARDALFRASARGG
jgi:CheY-like chemotaxis protein